MFSESDIYTPKNFINSMMSQDKVFKLLPELWFFADSPHGLPLQKAVLFRNLLASLNVNLRQWVIRQEHRLIGDFPFIVSDHPTHHPVAQVAYSPRFLSPQLIDHHVNY